MFGDESNSYEARKPKRPRLLIVAPTRELVLQIKDVEATVQEVGHQSADVAVGVDVDNTTGSAGRAQYAVAKSVGFFSAGATFAYINSETTRRQPTEKRAEVRL